MRSSKFIKLDVDVLMEWIYDDQNFLTEDYRVVVNTINDTRAFSQQAMTGLVNTVTDNQTENNLFPIDVNKWGILDPNQSTNRYNYIQYQEYPGNVPERYDIVVLHFPIEYTFTNYLGVVLEISCLNYSQTEKITLSNYFFDKTIVSRNSDLGLTAPPFMFEERMWGKNIQIMVPSPYYVSREVVPSTAYGVTPGSINADLAGNTGIGLSPQSPIFVDFGFLTTKNTTLLQTAYYSTVMYGVTLPQVPDFATLAVTIAHATDGDYFEINGLYNGDISDFNNFMIQAANNGNSSYIIFDVTVTEKTSVTGTYSFQMTENWEQPITFRPIIFYSNTTAAIQVTMRIVQNTDQTNILIRTVTYAMLQNEVSKYSRNLTKINVANTFKPKLYNAKPDQIIFNNADQRLTKTQTIQVPYPVIYDRFNILVKNLSEQVNDTTWYGLGQSQILLFPSPSDNIVKFAIGKGSTAAGMVPFQIQTGADVELVFKSASKLIKASLWVESGQVDFTQGMIVFRILANQMDDIEKIEKDGFDQYYITITDPVSTVTTILYAGRYLLYNTK
jgi:hypothetical protein